MFQVFSLGLKGRMFLNCSECFSWYQRSHHPTAAAAATDGDKPTPATATSSRPVRAASGSQVAATSADAAAGIV